MSDGYEEDLLEDHVRTNTFDPVLLRRLIGYAFGYPKTAIFGLFLVVLSSLMMILGPMLIGGSIDMIFSESGASGASTVQLLNTVGLGPLIDLVVEARDQVGQQSALTILAIAFGISIVLRFLLDWYAGYLLSWLSQSVLLDIRMHVFEHIQTRSLAYFHRHPVGRLITRVTNDVGSLDDFFSQALLAVIKNVFILSGITILMLMAHFELGLIALSVMPAMILISAIFRYFARRAYRRFRAALSKLNAVMAETSNGVRVVQLFNRQSKNQAKYEEVGDDYREGFMQLRQAWACYRPGYTALQAATMGLVLWFGGSWVLDGTISAGLLTLFILLAEMFFQPIRDLVEKFDIIQSAVTSGERIFTVLDEGDNIPMRDDVRDAKRFEGEIEFDDVHFEYLTDEPVLRGVNFNAKPGETIAIVGHTGAGKTTIINLLSRFYDIKSGAIRIDGSDIREFTLSSLRRNVAVVHQDVFLFAGTIRENLSLNTKGISQEDVERAAKAVNADGFIKRFSDGYDHIVEEQGKTFSAGERQLLSFARALAHDPSILILDEATSSIDTKSEEIIQDAMKTLMQGRTSIVIAHRLSTIQHADKILVMHKGQIAEFGKHQELLAQKGLYYKLYQLQFGAAA